MEALQATPQEVGMLFDVLGIEVAILDVDDTLLQTSDIFRRQEAKFFEHVRNSIPGTDIEKFIDIYQLHNLEAYSRFSVRPMRWTYVIDCLKEGFPQEAQGVLDDGLSFFDEIYKIPPAVVPGTFELLELLKKAGIRTEAATHAETDWTYFKLESTGLIEYLPEPNIISESSYKNLAEWKTILERKNFVPKRTLIAGDNLGGDIIAPSKLGVAHLAWVDYQHGWSVYRDGRVPPGVSVIDSIADLIPALKHKLVQRKLK